MPTLSIVMPVHDTGILLLAAVRSIVDQTLFAEVGDADWELLIVDDASTDPATLGALAEVAAWSPSIRVLRNVRARGAAGARNTAIFAARGEWTGFLDSDDFWYPDFLAQQRDAFATMPAARWRAAHFDVGDEVGAGVKQPLAARSPCLYRAIESDYLRHAVSTLRTPVDILLDCGCMQVMTVQLPTELLRSHGGFDETLECAEDYDLWLRLARTEDLHVAPIDAGVYRIRSGSLTRSGRPMYHGEDRMLMAARADRAFAAYRDGIDARLRRVYAKFCFHFREHGRFREARRFAMKLIALGPTQADGWRHLVAALLGR